MEKTEEWRGEEPHRQTSGRNLSATRLLMFRVFWTPDAEAALEAVLKASAEPTVIAAAARQLDQLVALGPEFGESRYESMRIGFAFPLGIQFEVLEDVSSDRSRRMANRSQVSRLRGILELMHLMDLAVT